MHIHFIQHVHFEHPGTILQWAKEGQHRCSFTKIFETASFPAAGDIDMLVIMGGPMGVYEENKYEWLKKEKAFIHSAIDTNKKLLGICLGAQLVAEALGATAAPHPEKEIGWWPVEKTTHHPLTQDMPQSFAGFHLHGDRFTLPPGATQLFRTAACEQQGFVYGVKGNIAGFQFHPEMEPSLLANMLEAEKASLVEAEYVQTAATISRLTSAFIPAQKKHLYAFLSTFCSD